MSTVTSKRCAAKGPFILSDTSLNRYAVDQELASTELAVTFLFLLSLSRSALAMAASDKADPGCANETQNLVAFDALLSGISRVCRTLAAL